MGQLVRMLPGIEERREQGDDGFKIFWEVYPRKVARAAAERQWQRIRPNGELQQNILDGLRRAIAYWRSQGTEKQFIPHASTWLNGQRWEDELGEDDPFDDLE